MALLEVSGIDAFYGRVQALRGASLAVDTGVVLGFAVVLSTMGIVLSWRLLSK